MTLETRARGAAQGIHRAVERMETTIRTEQRHTIERFDEYRGRRERNRAIAAIAVVFVFVAVALGAAYVLDRPDPTRPADELTPPMSMRIGTATMTETTCTLDGAASGPAGMAELTLVNRTADTGGFEVVRIESGSSFSRAAAFVERQRHWAEAGSRRVDHSPFIERSLILASLHAGGSKVITTRLDPGIYGIVCSKRFPDVGERPLALVGPIEVTS